MGSVHVCWHKLIGISLVWTHFKKEHRKYRVFTKGLTYILNSCYCNKHVTKAISQLHEGWDLWCVCSVCPPLTCSWYQNVLKCPPFTSTARGLCTRKFLRCPPRHFDWSVSIFCYSLYFIFRYSNTSITIDAYVISVCGRQIWSLS